MTLTTYPDTTSGPQLNTPIHLLQPCNTDLPLLTTGWPVDGWHHQRAGDPTPEPLRRPLAAAANRLRSALGYLRAGDPSSSLAAASAAMIQRDTRPGHNGLTVFSEAFPNDSGDAHYVHVAGRPPAGQIGDLAQLNIVSGVCLFSRSQPGL
jgi:hypothetical protein